MSHSSGASSSREANNDSNRSRSNGIGKHKYIYNILPSQRQLLCYHLDGLDIWPKLATIMSLRPSEIQQIRHQQAIGNSPNEHLLKIWGDQYNHTVTELFMVLKRENLFEAMQMLKDYVGHEYYSFLSMERPKLSDLLANDTKLLNCSKSPEITNWNNEDDTSSYIDSSSSFDICQKVNKHLSTLLDIDYRELTEATNNWDPKSILGKGGFGTVYKGYWKFTDVAIKQIHYRGSTDRESAKVQLQQSLNELKYLETNKHDNILPLYGYSLKGEKPCLVYQLMKGGTLEHRLNKKSIPILNFQQRINISVGTARGINFLHVCRNVPLIHGDIKPANILLDQCLEPKIGDFGLARKGPNSVNSSVEVSQLFGTKPYLPPEFINLKKLSTKVDVYSFGVMLLEIFTGMRVYDKECDLKKICTDNAQRTEFLIDKRMNLLQNEIELCKNILLIGLECISNEPQYRPKMELVLRAFNNCSRYFN